MRLAARRRTDGTTAQGGAYVDVAADRAKTRRRLQRHTRGWGATGSNLDLKWMAGKDQYRLFHWTNLRGGDHGETCRAPGFGASDAAAACADPALALCGNAGGDPERAASQRTAFTANTRPRSSIRDCPRDGGCGLCAACRRRLRPRRGGSWNTRRIIVARQALHCSHPAHPTADDRRPRDQIIRPGSPAGPLTVSADRPCHPRRSLPRRPTGSHGFPRGTLVPDWKPAGATPPAFASRSRGRRGLPAAARGHRRLSRNITRDPLLS